MDSTTANIKAKGNGRMDTGSITVSHTMDGMEKTGFGLNHPAAAHHHPASKAQAGTQPGTYRRQAGITLIELMIVIVIVAVLASLAIPSYRDYVLRTNRTEAMNQALEIAACQERVYIKENGYAADRCGLAANCILTPNEEYNVCIALGTDGALPANQSFTLTATPQGAQINDSCGNITLTDAGIRGASAAGTDAQIDTCWKGRKI